MYARGFGDTPTTTDTSDFGSMMNAMITDAENSSWLNLSDVQAAATPGDQVPSGGVPNTPGLNPVSQAIVNATSVSGGYSAPLASLTSFFTGGPSIPGGIPSSVLWIGLGGLVLIGLAAGARGRR
jgi:hypothetical protein